MKAIITKKEQDTDPRVYATINPPIEGHERVLVSGVHILNGLFETYIFPVNEKGEISWEELEGLAAPWRLALLEELGYTITDESGEAE